MTHEVVGAAGQRDYKCISRLIRRFEVEFRRCSPDRASSTLLTHTLQDDHVKNIAFLLDRSGAWSLSPAFDVMYAYNPAGQWTSRHQMTINGKSDGFEPDGGG